MQKEKKKKKKIGPDKPAQSSQADLGRYFFPLVNQFLYNKEPVCFVIL